MELEQMPPGSWCSPRKIAFVRLLRPWSTGRTGCSWDAVSIGRWPWKALKLKEISYIHAEGMPAAEMARYVPSSMTGCRCSSWRRPGPVRESPGQHRRSPARGGRVIAIVEEGDTAASLAEHVLEVPAAPEALQPLLTVVPCNFWHTTRRCFAEKMSTSQEIWPRA